MNIKSNYEELYKILNQNYEQIMKYNNFGKQEMEFILTKLNFKEEYTVVKLSSKLKRITGSKYVIITRSNLAYILNKHVSELNIIDFKYIPSIIIQHDFTIKGKSKEKGDRAFLKIIGSHA